MTDRGPSFRIWRTALVVQVMVLVLGAPARAADPQPGALEMRALVLNLISGYEPADPRAGFERLGPEATAVLLALIQDARTLPIRRLRAIEALGYAPTPEALAFLERLVSEQRDRADGRAAFELAAAARALGGYGVNALPELARLCAHESADVREGAAASLGRIGTPQALRLLRAQIRVERDEGVRNALRGALRTRR